MHFTCSLSGPGHRSILQSVDPIHPQEHAESLGAKQGWTDGIRAGTCMTGRRESRLLTCHEWTPRFDRSLGEEEDWSGQRGW